MWGLECVVEGLGFEGLGFWFLGFEGFKFAVWGLLSELWGLGIRFCVLGFVLAIWMLDL